MSRKIVMASVLASLMASTAAQAAVEVQWWHAFTGRLGELLQAHVDGFNASQSDYKVVATNKGNYSEALNAAIAAFRANEHPHLIQVFEVGTATMMAAKGAIKPVYEVMAEAGYNFDPADFVPAVTGYYTTPEGLMLSFPYNSSTQVLYVNRDKLKEAGVDPDVDLSTWEAWDAVLDQLKSAGVSCPYTTSWQSWVHLESFSAYHNLPFATKENGFGGLDTELVFNGPVQIAHITKLGEWAKDGKFIYGGRRNEAGASFRSGECALFTESSAGYAGVKAEAQFEFDIRHLPYWAGVEGAPLNTIIGGASVWVLANKKPEEYKGVAAFMNYLSSPEIQAKWHQDTGYLPITPAAAALTESQGFYAANPGTEIAGLQMTRNTPTENSKGLRLGSFDQIRTMIDEELEGVWAGQKDAKTALDSAVQRGNELLRRFEQANR
jgi:sn-glycerol 3-phosphate transport system substrate-binding protein